MSIFDDICKEYSASRKRYFDYRDECHDMARELISGLGKYLGCPEDTMSFHPQKEEDEKPGTTYSLMGAMNLQDDTYWHFKIGILIYEAPNISPKQLNLFDFSLKKMKTGKFGVKAMADGKEFTVDPKDPATFTAVYEEITKTIIAGYKTGLEKFLEQDVEVRKIGF